MDQFQVDPKSIKYLETSRGVAFTAQLNLNGQKFGLVENSGNGGATTVTYPGPAGRDLLAQAAKAKFPDAGGMTEESFLDYLMDVAEGVVVKAA